MSFGFTFDCVPKRRNCFNVFEQREGEAIDFFLVLHDEEGIVRCVTRPSAINPRGKPIKMQRTDVTEELDRGPRKNTAEVNTCPDISYA
jgi:hypothetical protein